MSFIFHTSSEALPVLAKTLLNEGDEVASRGGRVKELLNPQIQLTAPRLREVLTPGRKASLPAQIAETVWVLSGRDDINWLSNYLPRAPDFSDDGSTWRGAYGPRLRRWRGSHDQLSYVVDLLRNDRTSRRAVMMIFDPSIDHQPGKDHPCNDMIQFQSRMGYLHMTVSVRSNDLIWGWSGINAFEWSVLQEIVAMMVGAKVGTLTFNIGSLHVYEHHWSRADALSRTSFGMDSERLYTAPIPFTPVAGSVPYLDRLLGHWRMIEGGIRVHGPEEVHAEIEGFPEPLLRSWLRVLAWHWSGDPKWLETLHGTRLAPAALASPGSPYKPPEASGSLAVAPAPAQHAADAKWPAQRLVEYASDLHRQKHEAYGDSWKRRGEMMGIMANIARKVDRLGVSDENETELDTAVDLMIYLAKYRDWLTDVEELPWETDGQGSPKAVDSILSTYLSHTIRGLSNSELSRTLDERFESLETLVRIGTRARARHVGEMGVIAFELSLSLWQEFENEYRGADAD